MTRNLTPGPSAESLQPEPLLTPAEVADMFRCATCGHATSKLRRARCAACYRRYREGKPGLPRRPTLEPRIAKLTRSVPNTSATFAARVLGYVDVSGDCWEWTGTLDANGYGIVGRGIREARNVAAHRAVWMLLVGPIPADMEYDHLCRVHECVNPDHGEIVTPEENKRRGYGMATRWAKRTHCSSGHLLDGRLGGRGGSDKSRYCKTCARQRRAEEYVPQPKAPATHCQRGHPFTVENSYTPPSGSRTCRRCKADRQRSTRAAQRVTRHRVPAEAHGGCSP